MKGLRAVDIAKADGLDTEVYILERDGGLILVDVGFTPQCHESIQAELDEMEKNWGGHRDDYHHPRPRRPHG